MRAKFRHTTAGRPKGGRAGDCTVRSLATFMGWTYRHALHVAKGFVDDGETPVDGMTIDRHSQMMDALGLAEIKFPCETPVVSIADRLGDAIILIDCEPVHIVASVGGDIYDDRDSRVLESNPDLLMYSRNAWISPFPILRRKK